MSLLRHDRRALSGHSALVGVDEAGRGALAGPVVAAAVWLEASFYDDTRLCREGRGMNDSKQVSPEAREKLFAVIMGWQAAGHARVAVMSGSVEEINTHNILGATRLAMDRCLRHLHGAHGGLPTVDDENMPLFEAGAAGGSARPRILIDGRRLRPFFWKHDGLVDGDAKSFAIAAASILAKVTRDREMAALDAQFPGYGLAQHKGYGTPEHWDALRRLGPCPLHRPLFLRKMQETPGTNPEQEEISFAGEDREAPPPGVPAGQCAVVS